MKKIKYILIIYVMFMLVLALALPLGSVVFALEDKSAEEEELSTVEENQPVIEDLEEETKEDFTEKLTDTLAIARENIMTMAAVLGGTIGFSITAIILAIKRFKNIIHLLKFRLGEAKNEIDGKQALITEFNNRFEEMKQQQEALMAKTIEEVRITVETSQNDFIKLLSYPMAPKGGDNEE